MLKGLGKYGMAEVNFRRNNKGEENTGQVEQKSNTTNLQERDCKKLQQFSRNIPLIGDFKTYKNNQTETSIRLNYKI